MALVHAIFTNPAVTATYIKDLIDVGSDPNFVTSDGYDANLAAREAGRPDLLRAIWADGNLPADVVYSAVHAYIIMPSAEAYSIVEDVVRTQPVSFQCYADVVTACATLIFTGEATTGTKANLVQCLDLFDLLTSTGSNVIDAEAALKWLEVDAFQNLAGEYQEIFLAAVRRLRNKPRRGGVDCTPSTTCIYGDGCYRKSPSHWSEFSHMRTHAKWGSKHYITGEARPDGGRIVVP